MLVAVFAEVNLSLGLCSGSKNQSFARLGVVSGIVTSVSIATCGSWSRTRHLRAEVGTGELGAYAKEQSIPKRSPVAWRPACIPGGKPAQQPSAAAPAARLLSNRSPRRGAGTQMKGTVLFSGKQLCFCHLLLLSSQNDFVYAPASSADVSPALGIARGG